VYVWFILLHICVCDLQAQPGLSGKEAARWLLTQLRTNPDFPPFTAAANALAQQLLTEVLSSGQGSEPVDADAAAAAAAAAAAEYYMPVLCEVLASALQLFLQAVGTADGLSIYLPGEGLCISVIIDVYQCLLICIKCICVELLPLLLTVQHSALLVMYA
jgi:hypothetical protein